MRLDIAVCTTTLYTLDMVICVNGTFVPPEKASISVFDNAVMMGIGCYETIRIYNGKPWQLERHLQRFEKSAKALFLDVPYSIEEIAAWIRYTIEKNELIEARIRLMLTGGANKMYGGQDFSSSIVVMGEPLHELPPYDVDVITYEIERSLPTVKSLNMLPFYEANHAVQQANVYEALLVDQTGHITEGSKTNVFFVKDETLITAPDHVLPGITREVILEIASAHELKVNKSSIHIDDLHTMEECFLSNALIGIVSVRSITNLGIDFVIGSGTMTATIRDLFSETL